MSDGDLTAAIRGMSRIAASFTARPEWVPRFEQGYQQFRAACARHGYV
jgi:hypothetical protein